MQSAREFVQLLHAVVGAVADESASIRERTYGDRVTQSPPQDRMRVTWRIRTVRSVSGSQKVSECKMPGVPFAIPTQE